MHLIHRPSMSSTTTTARGTVQLNHPNPQHSTTPPYRSLFLRGYNNLKVPIVRCQSAILSTKQFLQGHDRSSSCSTLQDQSTRGNRDVQSGNIKHIVYPRSYPSHTGSIHPFFPITPSSESWPNTPMSHGCRTLGQDLVDTDSRMRHAPQLPPVQSISYDSKKVICELEQLAASVRDSSRAYNGRRPSHTSCPSNLARTGSTTPSLRSDSPSYAAPDRSRAFTSTSQSGVVGMNTVAPTKERRKHAYANDLSMEEQVSNIAS
ncbi:hypothetical protein C8Q80DRAFT_488643 [Daedaleopsis nitida]|nr:hypothetical protein C8Q80DRAFT_488643 [Daedaleopsis nitida]